MKRFHVHTPKDVGQACRMLTELEDATAYAGGTELILAMKEGFLQPKNLIDIKQLSDLNELRVSRKEIEIGATVTHRRIERSDEIRHVFPLLRSVEASVGNVRVRVSGTIGGNLAFAEPHSDIASLAVLFGATISLVGPGGARDLQADRFLLGPFETELEPGELLKSIRFPVPGREMGVGYHRFVVKERPLVVACATITIDEHAIVRDSAAVIAGATPVPTRCFSGAGLVGERLDRAERGIEVAAREAARTADVITDLEGGEDYKRNLVEVLVARALLDARTDVGRNRS